MADLSTRYLGLKLRNPLVASASPLSKTLESAKRLEDAGVSAIVLHSLFEEQILHETLELDHFLTKNADTYSEAQSYLPDGGMYAVRPDKYLEHLAAMKKSLSIPVIGSLNGISKGGWTGYAKRMEEAGADALELNLYYLVTDSALKSEDVETAQADLVAQVRAAISIPLAVKISPFVTALPHFASRIANAGADGLVLFNRFYQPDFDLEELDIVHSLDLSNSADLRLPLRWISILYGRIDADFALTSGVHTAQDVIKAMMAGAKVAMTASTLLRHGDKAVGNILSGIEQWMLEREYESITQMQGSMSQKNVREPAAFERANYMKVLSSWREMP